MAYIVSSPILNFERFSGSANGFGLLGYATDENLRIAEYNLSSAVGHL